MIERIELTITAVKVNPDIRKQFFQRRIYPLMRDNKKCVLTKTLASAHLVVLKWASNHRQNCKFKVYIRGV